MEYNKNKLKKLYFLVLGVTSLTSSIAFAQGYGPEGRVLRDGETPAPNAICQSYGYGNIMQTKCFDAEPSNGLRDTPKTARHIDLKDTVQSATSGEHRTVYTYRDKSGILHYTENVPSEYKSTAKVFKKGTIKDPIPATMISYPKELAGPAVAPSNPSVGSNYKEVYIKPDKGISSTGTKLKQQKVTKSKTVTNKKNTNKKNQKVKTTTNKVVNNSKKTTKKVAPKTPVKKTPVSKKVNK